MDEMVRWHHHQVDGHEFEPASGQSEGHGSAAVHGCLKEWDTTERLNNNHCTAFGMADIKLLPSMWSNGSCWWEFKVAEPC